jgi:hypothetical protein
MGARRVGYPVAKEHDDTDDDDNDDDNDNDNEKHVTW